MQYAKRMRFADAPYDRRLHLTTFTVDGRHPVFQNVDYEKVTDDLALCVETFWKPPDDYVHIPADEIVEVMPSREDLKARIRQRRMNHEANVSVG